MNQGLVYDLTLELTPVSCRYITDKCSRIDIERCKCIDRVEQKWGEGGRLPLTLKFGHKGKIKMNNARMIGVFKFNCGIAFLSSRY